MLCARALSIRNAYEYREQREYHGLESAWHLFKISTACNVL